MKFQQSNQESILNTTQPKISKPDKRCFNCGVVLKTLPKGEWTKDHIPPQCLFVGFPEAAKLNRKTVNCCLTCNNKFSKIDGLFRNVLGFAYDGSADITQTAMKELFNAGKIKRTIDGAISTQIPTADIHDFLKRCFKAIYYKQYGEVFPENEFDILIIDEHDEPNYQAGLILQQYVTHDQAWDVSGSSDVFKFSIKRIDFNQNNEMTVADNIESSKMVGAVMVFHEAYMSVVMTKRKQ